MRRRKGLARRASAITGIAVVVALVGSAGASALPSGFQESTALSGLTEPTVVRLAPDGRVLVAEQRGVVKSFSGPGDTSPEIVADLRLPVYNFWERGLLGMALDPNFAANGRIYVAYTYNAPIGRAAPTWGSSTDLDAKEPCPGWIFGVTTGPGCEVSGRISRLTLNGTANPPETVLINDWCQQYPSHTVGSLEFHGGALYASAGEGADFFGPDWGQVGSPPCGDPPNEGGALRSQDLRTGGDPVTLDGSVIRIDPTTGNALGTNPGTAPVGSNTRRIIAHGLRNPFRFAISPDDELWVGDVGWNDWEELNRFPANPASVVNFGWPCYEGAGRQSAYDAANLGICENLYGAPPGTVTAPRFAYAHAGPVVPGESCPSGSSALAGLDFYGTGPFPSAYNDALFFADHVRNCIWVMFPGADGKPDPATVSTFHAGASGPSFVEVGPDGALYYTDLVNGRVQRVSYNRPPTARAAASATSGPLPLAVNFDASASSDPNLGDTLEYEWDLDGDGVYDDSTAIAPQRTFTQPSTFSVRLRVTDALGESDTDSIVIQPGSRPSPPTAPKLKVRTLKLRIPDSRKRLIARGGRAKLRCNFACRVRFELVAKGRAAKRIGIDGTIATQAARMKARDPTWVVASLTDRAARRLRKADRGLQPDVVARIRARAR